MIGAGCRCRVAALMAGTAVSLLMAGSALAQGEDLPSRAEMWRVIQAQQKEIAALKARLEGEAPALEERPSAPATARRTGADTATRIRTLESRLAATEEKVEATGGLLEQALAGAGLGGEGWWKRTSVGGYGSVRFEASDAEGANTGFTFRRFVLALDSQVTDRLETYLELEFERFTELELEKGIDAGASELEISQALEGGSGSEISIEQAWARYVVTPALRLDFGALLMPVGRFNINHDDNQWVLPRRTLVDRGAPVLPAKAAWAELGAGLSGTAEIGGGALVDYRLYAVNGTTLDFELETELEAASEAGEDTELESVLEAEFGPSRGAFDGNANSSLALAGRVALRPAPGQEVALSGYVGNYVPSFLERDETLWSVGIDGLHHIGGFEVEYEAVRTHFDNLGAVASAFATRTLAKEREINGPAENGAFATHKIEFTLAKNVMAKNRTGYWVEIRRPFWPAALNDTVLGRGFAHPQLVPAFRMEQVFFDDQLQGIEFDGGLLSQFRTRDAHINRATLGLGYRPVPGWVVQLAGEYTWTPEDNLSGLTNFLDAGDANDTFSLLLGLAFNF